MADKVSYDVAAEDVSRWLDYKRVSSKKRETYKEAIESLTEGVMNGSISIDSDCVIAHLLMFPVEDSTGKIAFDKLTYKPRLSVGGATIAMKNVKPGDTDGRIMATVSALTDKAIGLLNKIDTEDNNLAQAVAIFFL